MREILRGKDREAVLEKILGRLVGQEVTRSTITMLLYGSLRFYLPLQREIRKLSKGKKLPPELETLVIMILYQIGFMDSIPNYAALNEGLNAIPKKYQRLKGFVTWLCHEFLRQPELLLGSRESYLPAWYQEVFEKSLGAENFKRFEGRILQNCDVYFEAPSEEILPEDSIPVFKKWPIYRRGALDLEERMKLEEGGGLICDLFSLLIPRLFSPAPGGRYLDLCSSPGGKLIQALFLYPQMEFHAVEKSASRMARLKKRLLRTPQMESGVSLHQREGVEYLRECKKRELTFSRILLDAPCSALGTVASHPEYLLTKQRDLPLHLRTEQEALLHAALDVLEPGGELIYSVCTFNTEETEDQLREVCTRADIESVMVDTRFWEGAISAQFGTYLLPTDIGSQIFYVAYLKKNGAGEFS